MDDGKSVNFCQWLYCIVLYMLPVPNPKSYDGARVLEASDRPILPMVVNSVEFVPPLPNPV